MAILGNLIMKGIIFSKSLEQQYSNPAELQKHELRKLLITASDTEFGRKHHFKSVLSDFKGKDFYQFFRSFKQNVPAFSYDEMYEQWWTRSKNGEKNICWPGRIKFFALSSGTSGTSSKYIPITKEQIKAIRRTSVWQLVTLSKYSLPDELFTTGVLLLGGSTSLNYNGTFFEGDLSGITTKHIPFWFQRFYKPGQKIARNMDWGMKLDEITRKADKWNIGVIAGVPAWVQILLEKIIDHYGISHIHEIWPDFSIFVHGGVAFEPYKSTFQKLLGKPLIYIETYLASEGFLAYQNRPDADGMKLVLNNGIFFEFVPFNSKNFDGDGKMTINPESLLIDEIDLNRDYAPLISTTAGAWRYLIGDTIQLVNRDLSEIIITGRTRHFLSLCGEHLSLDNMNKAILLIDDELKLGVKEFTVIGERYENLFAHRWYVGVEQEISSGQVRKLLDHHLKILNDDYRTERQHALREIFVTLLPNAVFYDFLRSAGKEGGQNKFPRVLKGEKKEAWENFLTTIKLKHD
ncbi:MAG: GH3 auxin-responsive promoter family protein [Cyclobacteriaceae bacterium]|nr:GH3 auxin-responsive promoter family protein [Cyclobacteriaceae bacterium]